MMITLFKNSDSSETGASLHRDHSWELPAPSRCDRVADALATLLPAGSVIVLESTSIDPGVERSLREYVVPATLVIMWASLWLLETRHTHVNHTLKSPSRHFREFSRYHVHGRQCGRDRSLPCACISWLENTAGAWDGSCHRRALRVGSRVACVGSVPVGRHRMGRLALTR
jgi:hypothetical protein